MIETIRLSLFIASIATVATFILGILFAEITTRKKTVWMNILEFIILFPLAIPPTVMGFYTITVLGNNGLFAKFFNISPNILFTPTANIIVGIIASLPIMYRAIRISFDSISTDIIDATKLDTSSPFCILMNIKIPLAYKGILAGILLSFLRVLGEFGASLMVSGNIKGYTQTIPISIWEAVMNNDLYLANIQTMFLIILSFSMLIIVNLVSSNKEQMTFQNIKMPKFTIFTKLKVGRNI